MLRNQVAKHIGLDIETIRFYEKEKLISEPKRLDNGYRSYTQNNIKELKFIQHCRSLGLNLDEIKQLKTIEKQPSTDCSKVQDLIKEHIQLIDDKIRELKNLKTQLNNLHESCHTVGDIQDCEIVKSLKKTTEDESCACHPPSEIKKRDLI